MFTHAKLILSDYDKTTIGIWVKCNELPYFFLYGFITLDDYAFLKWKLKNELKMN